MNKILNFFKRKPKRHSHTKNKKGLVFTILGAFTLVGIMYLFMIFLDLFNIMYTQITFQGDVRASSLHGANHYDEYLSGKGQMYLKTGFAYSLDQTADYNAKKLFDLNFQNHYRIVKNASPGDFTIDGANPNLKVKVFNLTQLTNGTYVSQTETTPDGKSYTHDQPGISVYVELPLKSWTFFFKDYKVTSYSYSSPVDTSK